MFPSKYQLRVAEHAGSVAEEVHKLEARAQMAGANLRSVGALIASIASCADRMDLSKVPQTTGVIVTTRARSEPRAEPGCLTGRKVTVQNTPAGFSMRKASSIL